MVGARRRRQGTGEYVARELARQGCAVVAVVGTRPETVGEARAQLAERYGISCRGYTSLAELLDAEAVDLVAVCSPPEAHEEQVALAAERGCHVLCEKPFFWEAGLAEGSAAEVAARAERLVAACAERGRHLALNTQWPFTLDAFRRLHPEAYGPGRPVERFEMLLGPVAAGTRALVDSGSHFVSMLWALVGPGQFEELRLVRADRHGERQTLRARYRHAAGAVEASLRLERSPAPPRPAGYAINGRSVRRHVELPAYRLSFRAGEREVPLEDPLVASVQRFVRKVRAGEPPDREAIVAGQCQLHRLVAAGSLP